jgi:transposase
MGPDVGLLCERILADRPHPEQGFRAFLGIIHLGKSFGRDRVNAACARALEIGARTYGSMRSILDDHLDRKASSNEAASIIRRHLRVNDRDHLLKRGKDRGQKTNLRTERCEEH